MVESNLEAARPKPSRRRPSTATTAKRTATDTIFKGLDRFGLAPVLVLLVGWWAASKVLEPLLAEYRDAVRAISETNKLLKDEVASNDVEDCRRVEAITKLQNENRALLVTIQEQLKTIEATVKGSNGSP